MKHRIIYSYATFATDRDPHINMTDNRATVLLYCDSAYRWNPGMMEAVGPNAGFFDRTGEPPPFKAPRLDDISLTEDEIVQFLALGVKPK